MGSWGASTTDESKPKYLTDEEKKNCFANEKGWTVPVSGNDNAAATREVLVAIGGLSGADYLAGASVSSVYYGTTSFSFTDGGTISVVVNYNEQVDVTGTPRVKLTNSRGGSDFNLNYASGTGTNRLTFSLTLPASDATTAEDDVLTIALNALNLNSGTIKDKGTSTVSEITHTAVSNTLTVAA